MKKYIYILATVALALVSSCQKPYELTVGFAVNREELRFSKSESQSYFMVYSTGSWKVSFEKDVPWARMSAKEGNGNTQINVNVLENTGVSRGVDIIVENVNGETRRIYLSQDAGMTEAKYQPEDNNLDLFASALDLAVPVITNLDEESVAQATYEVSYEGAEQGWVSNIALSLENIKLSVGQFTSTGERVATIIITFPAARWDEKPCTAAFAIRQTDGQPVISVADKFDLDASGLMPTTVDINCNWNTKYYSYDLSDYALTDASWMESVVFDGASSYTILPKINEDAPRSTVFSVKLKTAEGAVLSTVSTTLSQAVAEKPLEPEDLSADGHLANCYIVEKLDTALYCFDLKKLDGSAIEGATGAKVLWQTTKDMIQTPYVKDGKLYFIYSPDKTGNAVVAATNGETILWSWHIWVSGYAIGTNKFGANVFMDRNLGALAAGKPEGTSAATAGMHYEWGRKDPFPPIDSYTPSGNRDHMATYPSDAIKFVVAQTGWAYDKVTANPCTYLWGSAASGAEDWIDTQSDDLWGETSGTKSVNDPCPYGYEVPTSEQYADILTLLKAVPSLADYSLKIKDDNGDDVYFQCPGYYRRSSNTSSQLCNVATFGWYWTRTSGVVNTSYRGGVRLQVHNTVANRTTTSVPRRWGANVRCVKQK